MERWGQGVLVVDLELMMVIEEIEGEGEGEELKSEIWKRVQKDDMRDQYCLRDREGKF